ncbi:ferritin-like domain-containing protein [Autumnicola edwardsiae]|uniref:Ferritin-like domain-containing protein n=1 Tax=Autumnicola edwardsiae TaxID=3075594 RepID=A0ABU3CUA4_9FLAO|nr:ferritin-like domain-containing protein [Zunongwangia sp. F297]MDT0649939.1 ferritin-like domain-containing protein [Zunongwangia sp. F297]
MMKRPIIKVRHSDVTPNGGSASRRKFLKLGGLALAGGSLLLYSCSEEELSQQEDILGRDANGGDAFNLGTGDLAILNYAYILEQLEAAFYTRVLEGSYWESADPVEKLYLEDLQAHEVIHREFFKTVLSATFSSEEVAPDLEFDFSTIDFSDRDSVLGTSIVLEDTGVSAYNGAGDLIENPAYLVAAGKIVSVEARHASALRSIYLPGFTEFAGDDIIDENGLDLVAEPKDVLDTVVSTGFIENELIYNNIPNG